MEKNPLISVIVTVYNVEQYLKRCIDSILSQTFTNFEILLIDDGSTDCSGVICDEYKKIDDRIKVFHKKNGGVSSARNMGLDNAMGEWITFVDADDWIDKDMYSKLYNEAQVSNADIVLCDFYLYYSNSKIVLYNSISTNNSKEEILRKYILSFTSLFNTLVHSTLYSINNLRIPEYIVNCEDFWLTVRLFYYAKRIYSVHIPLYYYNRENINSILNNLNEERYNSERLAYLDTITFFQNNGVLDLYEREISWRILKCKQDMVLNPQKHNRFLEIYPQSHKYIFSCPTSFCNYKIKFIMWLLTHNMRLFVILFCKVRSLIGRD